MLPGSGFAFTRDGTRLVVQDGYAVAVYPWPDRQQLQRFVPPPDRTGALSPDGRFLAGSRSGAGIGLVDLQAEVEVDFIPLADMFHRYSVFAPDGKAVAVVGSPLRPLTGNVPAFTVIDLATRQRLFTVG